MPFLIERNDLAHMSADCLVVSSDSDLTNSGGVSRRLARVAGLNKMQQACRALAPVAPGSAVVTPAFHAHARCVVHVVGPQWTGGGNDEDAVLRRAYRAALDEALEAQAHSVAMPLISTGRFGFPVRRAFDIATSEIRTFLNTHDEMSITLVLWDDDAYAVGKEHFPDLANYIEEALGSQEDFREGSREGSREGFRKISCLDEETPCLEELGFAKAAPKRKAYRLQGAASRSKIDHLQEAAPKHKAARQARSSKPTSDGSLGERLQHIDAPFSTTLLMLIDERGFTDAQVYKRANMSRQLFSKIRSDPDYRPTKKTVLALAIALELPLELTRDLLSRAGFALSHANVFDVIVEYFISNGKYDIFEINEALYAYDQPLLA